MVRGTGKNAKPSLESAKLAVVATLGVSLSVDERVDQLEASPIPQWLVADATHELLISVAEADVPLTHRDAWKEAIEDSDRRRRRLLQAEYGELPIEAQRDAILSRIPGPRKQSDAIRAAVAANPKASTAQIKAAVERIIGEPVTRQHVDKLRQLEAREHRSGRDDSPLPARYPNRRGSGPASHP